MVQVRGWSGVETARLLRVPDAGDDKYSRGVVALRTGSVAYPGAAVLGVEGAWRAGAGFVRYVGAERVVDAVLARRPETVAGSDIGATRVDAWVIGSGTDGHARIPAETAALGRILAGSVPVVVDAGALDLVAEAAAPLLLTPHAGEFARLRERLGLRSDPAADRAAEAAETAAALGCTVLLKGATTLVASAAGTVVAVSEAPGWLSTAGAGDVLAGVLGALWAAHGPERVVEVAAAGAWLHDHAARLAAGAVGGAVGRPIVAMDVAEALPEAVAELLS